MTPADQDDLARVVRTALEEDLRYGPDATTAATVPPGSTVTAAITSRQAGTVAGIPVARAVFDAVCAGSYEVVSAARDGSRVAAGTPVLTVRGDTGKLLTAERTALNLLCHLSGVATATAAWVDVVAGTATEIRDSRKTLPGLRQLQKYAVRCGGGRNHRLGLGDAILIKDNHVAAAGSVTAALLAARRHAPELRCEVEVDTTGQLREALEAGAEEILLDNFPPWQCAEAALTRDGSAPAVKLEASGGLRLENARAYAESGVDYLAVGGLTHSAPALDLGMDLC